MAPNEGYARAHTGDISPAEFDKIALVATALAETPVGRVYAFLSPADPMSGSWHPVPLDGDLLFGVHGQAPASFDGSARPQIVVAETNIGGFGFGVNPDPQL